MSVKKYIKRLAKSFGYEIKKIQSSDDLAMYQEHFGAEAVKRRAFINIGAGSFYHPAWTNVDFDSDWYKINRHNIAKEHTVQFDLFSLLPLPFDAQSIELAYTSHTIEHLTDSVDEHLFREVYRILKKGGTFRVTTNNIDLTYQAYTKNDRSFFYWSNWRIEKKDYEEINLVKPMTEASTQQLFLFDFASQLSTLVKDGPAERIDDADLDRIFRTMPYEDALNHCTTRCSVDIQKSHPGFHINWFNPAKTMDMLKKAGFKSVTMSAYGQSNAPVLRNTSFFDTTHPKVSLYVEATK